MAIITENNCVGCEYCIGCGRRHQEAIVCDADKCDEYAEYSIDGEDFCEEHAKEYLIGLFSDMTVSEMAEMLEIDIKSY